MVGASGAIFGVIAAFSLLYPNAEMFIMFIPFPIKAKVLFPITIIVSLYLRFFWKWRKYCPFCTYWWRFSRVYFDKKFGVETDIELINQWGFSEVFLPLLM